MPQIIVRADPTLDGAEGAITMKERVISANLTSGHFGAQLIERVSWAVRDAHEAERVVEARGHAAHLAAQRVEAQPAAPELRLAS
jgi:hypothetical protein